MRYFNFELKKWPKTGARIFALLFQPKYLKVENQLSIQILQTFLKLKELSFAANFVEIGYSKVEIRIWSPTISLLHTYLSAFCHFCRSNIGYLVLLLRFQQKFATWHIHIKKPYSPFFAAFGYFFTFMEPSANINEFSISLINSLKGHLQISPLR